MARLKLGTTIDDYLVWHEGNSGEGSGSDTDLLHGMLPSINNISNTIVQRDSSGNFSANNITASLNGNASTASKLAIPREILISGDAAGSVNFDGNENVELILTVYNNSHDHDYTISDYFKIYHGSPNAINLIATSGILEIKNADNTAYADLIVNNLIIKGESKIVESSTLSIGDNIIDLNVDYEGSSPTESAGINVNRGTLSIASLIWDETNDYWAAGLLGSEYKIWTAGNHGIGSGLNADLLDGYHADTNSTISTIVRRDNSGNFSANIITASLSGNASTASKWNITRNITLSGDVSGTSTIDGSSDVSLSITVADNSHNHISSNITDATNNNTANTIVQRDSSGDFSANIITAALSGNASTASKLFTSRSISFSGDVSGSTVFDGSEDKTINIDVVDNSHNHTTANISDASADNVINTMVKRDSFGNFASNIITASLNGNASTATKLETTRSISISGDATGSANFDGSENIDISLTVTAALPSGYTTGQSFILYKDNTDAIMLKDNGGVLELKNQNDTEYKDLKVRNLTTTGTLTSINTEELTIYDNVITLNADIISGTPAEDAGIEIKRGSYASASFIWNESTTSWKCGLLGSEYKIWTEINDGVSSGLDADLLDGKHASEFAVSTHSHDYLPLAGGTITGQLVSTLPIGTSPFNITSITLNTNLNADLLDGKHANEFALVNQTMYIGTTAVAINRTTADLTLSGITLTSPTFTTPILGTPVSGDLSNCTFPVLNQNTTGSAAKWTTTRTLSLTGDVTGSVSIDGSADVTITTTVANDSHTHSTYVPLAGGSMTGELSFGSTTKQMINLYASSFGIGIQSSTQYYRSSSNYAWFTGGVHSNTAFDPGTGGTLLMKLSATGLVVPNNTSYTTGQARNIYLSTAAPSGGGNGDVWIKYTA